MSFTFRSSGGNALAALGPVIDVHLRIPSRLRESRWKGGLIQEGSVPARLLIDTGASITSMHTNLIARLGLASTDIAFINTPSTLRHPVEAFEIDLEMDSRTVFRNLRVFGIEQGKMSLIDGLLGRDVLQYGVFTYEGMHKCWSIELHPPIDING